MAAPKWLTKAGFLTTITEKTSVSIPITASGTDTTFSIIAGKLPSGVVLQKETDSDTTSTTGYLVGNPTAVPTTLTSNFVIRAKNSEGIGDKTFSIDVISNTNPLWLTPEGYLPVGTSGEYFAVNEHIVDYQLSAIPNVLLENMELRYYIEDGDGRLPTGLTLTEDGRIHGTVNEQTIAEDGLTATNAGYDTEKYDRYPYDSVEIIDNNPTKPKFIKKVYQFYVTASDGFRSSKKLFKIQVLDVNSLRDDTTYINADSTFFTAGVGYLYSPAWLSPANLGIRRASNYQIVKIKTYDPFPEFGTVKWHWDGISVNPEIRVVADTQIDDGPVGIDITIKGTVAIYDDLPTDASIGDVYKVYNTDINYAWDGSAWIVATFYPRYNRRGDSLIYLKDLTSLPSVGQKFRLDNYIEDAVYPTVYTVTSVSGNLSSCQIGFQHTPTLVGNDIIYDTTLKDDIPDNAIFYLGSECNRPPGFTLDQTTGNLYGQIPYIPSYSIDYKFTIRMVKTEPVTNLQSISDRVFTLRLQGNITTDLQWLTTSTVGVIRTGYQSELSIKAAHENFPDLGVYYRLTSGTLPEGLEFKSDGSIVGKIPYRSTTELDGGVFEDFTIDGGSTTLDRKYTFTAEATNAYRLATIDKEFTIILGENAPTPYSSVYVRPFMQRSMRRSYRDFINDTNIFDSTTLYRSSDPAFGIQQEIKMIIEHGLERLNLAEYVVGLQNYFYNKRFYFGDIKTLPAHDENGNYVYDIVYADIIDTAVSNTGKSPDSISFLINQGLVDVYTNSVNNWQKSLEAIQVYGTTIKVDEFLRPRFMRTIQSSTGAPLGFIKAVPICYVKPGYGSKTVRKIELSGFDFKMLDFEVDRLIIDQTFDFAGDKYLKFPIKNADTSRPLNVLAGPDGVIITDENGTELFIE